MFKISVFHVIAGSFSACHCEERPKNVIAIPKNVIAIPKNVITRSAATKQSQYMTTSNPQIAAPFGLAMTGCEEPPKNVIARNAPKMSLRGAPQKCHCEERSDEAISVYNVFESTDCFASLAMTY